MVELINLHDWLKTEKRISSNKCDVDLVTSASSYSLGGITFNRSKHLDQAPLDWAGGGHLMGDPLLLKSLLIKPAWRQRRRLAQSGHHVGDAQEASSPAAPAPPHRGSALLRLELLFRPQSSEIFGSSDLLTPLVFYLPF